MTHVLKIKPYSEAEQYFIDLMDRINYGRVICKIGKDYNEYRISDDAYQKIRNILQEKKS